MVTKTRSLALSGQPTAALGHDEAAMAKAAREMLDRHDRAVVTDADIKASEADIRSCIRDLLLASGLARREDIQLESQRTDLRTGQAIFEVKRRIGLVGAEPSPENLEQLDGYLDEAAQTGRPERLGILADGRHWALRPSSETGREFNASQVRTFTLRTEHDAGDWLTWMRDRIGAHSASPETPSRAAVGRSFGTTEAALNEVAELRGLYDANTDNPTVAVKRGLWEDLLGSALGEVVSQTDDPDGLFVRHTYLAAATALALQASFGLDIEGIAASGPHRLTDGTAFAEQVGVRGVIESDFFGWPTEVAGGARWTQGLANLVGRFDWESADYDIGSVLYQSVITSAERKRLGEYDTPDWLAEMIVETAVDDPLNQRVLDPACGSGTFLRQAIKAHAAAAAAARTEPDHTLAALQHQVIGVDVHPVAVHLARARLCCRSRDLARPCPSPTPRRAMCPSTNWTAASADAGRTQPRPGTPKSPPRTGSASSSNSTQ